MITRQYFDNFLLCLNEERFYDAHEVLEEIWYPQRFEKSNEVKLIKGFINASVCFELIKKGRITQSNTPWQTYLKYKDLPFTTSASSSQIYDNIFKHIELTKKKLDLRVDTI